MDENFYTKGPTDEEIKYVKLLQNGSLKHMHEVLKLIYLIYDEIPNDVHDKLEQDFYYGKPDVLELDKKIAGEAGNIQAFSDKTCLFLYKCCRNLYISDIDILDWRFLHSSYTRKSKVEMITFKEPILDLIEEKKEESGGIVGIHSS